jgi:hypothetical protein
MLLRVAIAVSRLVLGLGQFHCALSRTSVNGTQLAEAQIFTAKTPADAKFARRGFSIHARARVS